MKKLLTVALLLLLTTSPSSLLAQNEVAVYQESSPGMGDFDDNFLGCIDVFDQLEYTAEEVYQYNTPYAASYNGTVTPSLPDTSQLFFVNTIDGVSLFVVHDQPVDGDGGGAEMRFELSGDSDGAARLVEDDNETSRPGNLFGPEIFQTHHRWSPCCTDGVVIGEFDDNWSMLVSFHNVDGTSGNQIVGITDWVVTSADGNSISLDLLVDQRVLLKPCKISVAVDIKPGSCPNPLNTKSKGVLPVAILCTEDFDVTQIDPASIQLEGVAPLRWAFADVSTPFEPFVGKGDCFEDCNELCGDGYTDLVINFDRQEVIAAIGEVGDGNCLVLELTGNLQDSTPIVGEDVVKILKKGKH